MSARDKFAPRHCLTPKRLGQTSPHANNVTMDALNIDSPIGPLFALAEDDQLVRFGFTSLDRPEKPSPFLHHVAQWVDDYFEGNLEPFALPLAPLDSPFQKKVRDAMLAIPFGQTRTYGEIATEIGGNPRAVGQACGLNPIPIIVPCHRVLGANGALGGFSGGDGRPTKKRLLAHEALHTFTLTP